MSVRLSTEQRARAAGFARTAGAISRRVARSKGMLHAVDELRGVAFEALSLAALGYDPSHPSRASFSTYAWRRVTGAVLRAAKRENDRLSFEEPLDAAEGIADGGRAANGAEAMRRIDAGTGEIMRAFAMSCACTDLRGDGEAMFLKREAYAEVQQAVAALPEHERLLFERRHRDQLPWEEVAERLGISEKTARSREADIRDKLRRAILGRRRLR